MNSVRDVPDTTGMEKPPIVEVGLIGWLKQNLFRTWYDTLVTFGSLAFVYWVLRTILGWAIIRANYTEETCKAAKVAAIDTGEPAGACWGVVITNIKVLMVGRYPAEYVWRVWLCIGLLIALGIITLLVWRSASPRVQRFRTWLIVAWILSFPVLWLILEGFGEDSPILPGVSPNLWGGLLLTMVLSIIGIVASFPLGLLLALGRRSKLPVVKVFCTVFIEVIRGVPLITVLFMAQIMLPLFLPSGLEFGKVIRALAGIILFTAAYTAEIVRGGLQAVPKGQYEAAQAVGLNNALAMSLIVLPQALRAVILPIFGQFIALFKDTTLVAIVGLLDLLGVSKAILSQQAWIGLQKEVYLFAAVIYFIFSYAMSTASRHLEHATGVGER
jgi:general L-amino acid transport system permease protein